MEALAAENDALKARIRELEHRLQQLGDDRTAAPVGNHPLSAVVNGGQHANAYSDPSEPVPPLPRVERLTKRQVARYSRQLLMPDIGPAGQKRLAESSALIVGAGGLGSPAALYLAGSGIGRIGIVDFDVVELNNLHRQIIHTEDRIGALKCDSAASSIRRFNSDVQTVTYAAGLTVDNALSLVSQYDVVLDCSDNAPTRYLINDACVATGKPLVSGSALQMEGQLTVYNWGGGPCYRCLYPVPPPPNMVQRCADGGVLGVVPGVIGCLQALEAIKLAAGIGSSLARRLILFDALESLFRTVKLRGRNPNCAACGDEPSVTSPAAIDYQAFCGGTCIRPNGQTTIKLLPPAQRVTCMEYKEKVVDAGVEHLLIDCRPTLQYSICALAHSRNIPTSAIATHLADISRLARKDTDAPLPVYLICRRGNQSQHGAKVLLDNGFKDVWSIDGGVTEWATTVDPTFPAY